MDIDGQTALVNDLHSWPTTPCVFVGAEPSSSENGIPWQTLFPMSGGRWQVQFRAGASGLVDGGLINQTGAESERRFRRFI